jgi:hypothetical protein
MTLIIVACFLALSVLVGQFVLRFIYSYDIKGGAIRILLFSAIPIIRIPISQVVEVTRPPTGEFWLNPFHALRFGNRLIGNAVLIRKKRGLIKSIIITPDNPDRFIDQCNSEKREAVVRTAGVD